MAKTLKLIDLQLILLSTAAARDDGTVFPLKDCIKDKTAEVAKAITPLLKHALVVEYLETVLVRVWREDSDQRIGLAITEGGRSLIDNEGPEAAVDNTIIIDSPPPVTVSVTAVPRTGSKIGHVIELLAAMTARPRSS